VVTPELFPGLKPLNKKSQQQFIKMEVFTKKIYSLGVMEANVDSSNLGENLLQIQKQGIEYININASFGWTRGTTLDFLKDNTWIKGLWLVEDNLDLTPVNYLTQLNYFGFSGNNYRGTLDFGNISNLTFLTHRWDKKVFKNFEACEKLETLEIYRCPYIDSKPISHFKKLKQLTLNFTKIESLAGIETLNDLFNVDIYSAPKLKTIDSLEHIACHLKKLSFELCPKIENFSVLDSMTELETFYIYRSAPLHSVSFIKNQHNLKYAYIGADVLDKNVEILREKKIEFKKSKLYV
jgi:hypothetical protein